MTPKNHPDPAAKTAQAREDRLKAALKANLARRKAQNRARTGGQGEDAGTPEPSGQNKDA